MQIRLNDTRLALRNSTTRLPFRYGKACLTWCPQAILEADVEVDGVSTCGYSGDCLPPGWFDKSPDKDYRQQIAEMIAAIDLASQTFMQRLARPTAFFPAWLESQAEVQRLAVDRRWPALLASFGASMVECAILDAVARRQRLSFAELIRQNVLQIDAGAVDQRLAGCAPADWLPPHPREKIFVRHTVGLSDPLTDDQIPVDERLNDGQPQSLEQYVQQTGVRYFKVKVCNQLEHDLQRLRSLAAVVERSRGTEYRLTLDGNEQYTRAEDFDELIDAIRADAELQSLWQNTLLIEQPLARDIAMQAEHTAGVRQLCAGEARDYRRV